MLASDAFNPNIHSHSDDLHLVRAARMRLLHLDDIAEFKLFPFQSLPPLFPDQDALSFDIPIIR